MSEQLLQDILAAVKSIDERLAKVEKSVAAMEQEHANKIIALFDGYTLHGDQLERLQEHLDERLDAIQTDVSYLVGKVAQHDRTIVKLNRIAK